MPRQLTIGSLFAGIGGFDEAFRRAGYSTSWQVELDPSCRGILERHFPDAERFADVCAVDRSVLSPVDILCGGFPCQDLSVAGRRAGLAGQRSGLWWEFHRLIDELAPEWVLAENVPGLLSSGQRRDMGIVIGSLAELGYGVAWRVLDAQNFGVPQRRRRVFIVGHRGKPWSAPSEILFESESVCWDSPSRREAREEVAGTLGGGAGSRGWAPDTDRMTFLPVVGRVTSNHHSDVTKDTYLPMIAPTLLSSADNGYDMDGTGRGTPIIPARTMSIGLGSDPLYADEKSQPLTTRHGDPGVIASVPAWSVSENQRAEVRLTEVARQLTAGGGKPGQGYAAVMTEAAVRRLTPLECERLQGFPDGWTAGQSDGKRYRQLGNAVAVPVIEWIADRMAVVDAQLTAEATALSA